MRKIFTLSFIAFTSSLLISSLATRVSHGSATNGTLENKAQAVQWLGTIARASASTNVESFGIKPEPTPTIKQPFRWTPCNGNNSWFSGGLKPETLNPAPKRWQIVDISIDDLNNLGNSGKLNDIDGCGKASDGNWYCFFNSLKFPNRGKLACVARAKIFQIYDEYKHQIDPMNNPLHPSPYCAGGQPASTADYFSCYVYWKKDDSNPDSPCITGSEYIKNPPNDTGDFYTLVEWNACQANQSLEYCDNTDVEGPYRLIPDMYTACGTVYDETNGINKGMEYQQSQKETIRNINRAKPEHNGQLVSDLAGFCYPKPPNVKKCLKSHQANPNLCEEPGLDEKDKPLVYQKPYNQQNAAEINHVLPKKDTRGCPCGKNSNKNAVLISRQLNRYFTNTPRTEIKDSCTNKTELEIVNEIGMNNPYLPSSLQLSPLNKLPKKKTKNIMRKTIQKSKKPGR